MAASTRTHSPQHKRCALCDAFKQKSLESASVHSPPPHSKVVAEPGTRHHMSTKQAPPPSRQNNTHDQSAKFARPALFRIVVSLTCISACTLTLSLVIGAVYGLNDLGLVFVVLSVGSTMLLLSLLVVLDIASRRNEKDGSNGTEVEKNEQALRA